MPDWYLLLNGVIIGIVIAAPVGPVNLICIRQTLAYGRLHGIMAGLGGAIGDGVFATVAAFGLTALSAFIVTVGGWVQAAGGVFLIGLGLHTYFHDPRKDEEVEVRASGQIGATMGATFVLTVTNPATMLAFIAIFGGAGGLISETPSFWAASLLVPAVFLGSMLWWIGVSLTVGLLSDRMTEQTLILINRVSGVLIMGFGLAVLGRLAWQALA